MDDDTTELFDFPAIGRKKLTAAFDSGRLTSDGGVMLLAAAERQLGICDRLTALIAGRRDPSRVVHPLADILWGRCHQARRPETSNACRTSEPDTTAASGCAVAPNAQISPLRPPAIVPAE